MPLPEVEQILEKYKKEENRVESLLKEKSVHTEKFKTNRNEYAFPSFAVVKNRNKKLIADFEAVKGRLRSRAIFCPTEVHWENACREYQENTSLPVVTWKCHTPIFV